MKKQTKFIILLIFLIYADVSATDIPREIRALWVTRWDYQSPHDIQNIVRNAKDFNFNLILFQVRGNGTVFYPSAFEPWAKELGGKDPGWNPLATAIQEAHTADIRLHAWINVFPGWSGINQPSNLRQLYNAHPDWFMADEDQQPMPLNSHYVWLNPLLPEVQNYLEKIVLELAEVPGLDGIHFDYFRFPGPGFSYDSCTVNLFKNRYGITIQDSISLWVDFRRHSITNWLAKIYQKIKITKPDFVISSATIGDFDNGPSVFLQNSHAWLEQGIIDMIFPMTYTRDMRMFERWLGRHAPFRHNRMICPGLMIYPDSAIVLKQIRMTRKLNFPGMALFAYSSLFNQHKPTALVKMLCDSVFSDKATLPKFATKKAPSFFSEIRWFPPRPTSNDSIRIVCKLAGIDSIGDFRVFGIWKHKGKIEKVSFLQLSKNPVYYYSKFKLPPQAPGSDYTLRLFAYKIGKVKETAISSDEYTLLVDTPDRYFLGSGSFGPLATSVTRATVDFEGNIWFFEPGKGIRVLNPDGAEITENPISQFEDLSQNKHLFQNISDLETTHDGHVVLLTQLNGDSYILSNRKYWQQFSVLSKLPLSGFDFAIDSTGNFFVLQSNAWYVASPKGEILCRCLFDGIHSPNNLAVTPNGKHVLIACRTEGKVHHWLREMMENSAIFSQVADLQLTNIGIGGVTCAPNGFIYLAAAPGGFIQVMNRHFQIVDFLQAGKPALLAPRLVVPSPQNDFIYILETGGTTPVRMHKWERVKQGITTIKQNDIMTK